LTWQVSVTLIKKRGGRRRAASRRILRRAFIAICFFHDDSIRLRTEWSQED
jgi:hypothetical protein